MDFCLTAEQQQIQSEMGRAFERIAPLSRIRAMAQDAGSSQRELWQDLRDLGLPGLLIDARHGGLGLGILDAAIVAEQLGRHAVPGPFVATSVMAPLAITLAGTQEQQTLLLPRFADGSLVAGVGISEAASGNRAGCGIVARKGRLTGGTNFVIDSALADVFILADRDMGLHVVRRDAPGLIVTPLDTVDRTRSVCRLDLHDTPCEALPIQPARALRHVRDAGRIVLAADSLGAAWCMIDKAVEYAGQRRQFGRLIGSFQAVKHMCAEMAAELEPGRALIWYAAYAQYDQRDDAELTTLHAKAYLGDASRMVARTATEVHGGIGITDALGLHFWFKRIGWNFQLLGAPDRLREEAARLQDIAA